MSEASDNKVITREELSQGPLKYNIYVLPSFYDPDYDRRDHDPWDSAPPESAQFSVSAFTALPTVDAETKRVLSKLSLVSRMSEANESAARQRKAPHPLKDESETLIGNFIHNLSLNIPAGSNVKLVEPSTQVFDLTSHGLHAVSCVDPQSTLQSVLFPAVDIADCMRGSVPEKQSTVQGAGMGEEPKELGDPEHELFEAID